MLCSLYDGLRACLYYIYNNPVCDLQLPLNRIYQSFGHSEGYFMAQLSSVHEQEIVSR